MLLPVNRKRSERDRQSRKKSKERSCKRTVRITKKTGRNPRSFRNPGSVSDIFGFQRTCDFPYHSLVTCGDSIKISTSLFRISLVEKNTAWERSRKGVAVKSGLVNEPSLEPPVKGSLLHSTIGEGVVRAPGLDALPAHHFGAHQENRKERAAENQCDKKPGHDQNDEVHNLCEITDHLIDLFLIHGGEEA